jgi:hypothetical protein
VFASQEAWHNRGVPILNTLFSRLIGCNDLLVSVDRACLMVPTRNVPTLEQASEADAPTLVVKDRPDLKTADAWYDYQRETLRERES